MTKENKELLLQDLNTRLQYGVMCRVEDCIGYEYADDYDTDVNADVKLYSVNADGYCQFYDVDGDIYIEDGIKPYLRPMSSMTKEERKELNNQGYTKIAGELYHYCALSSNNAFYNPERHPYVRMEYVIKLIDWLNAHHFDYRGLIEKGLAIEAPNRMYKTNKTD